MDFYSNGPGVIAHNLLEGIPFEDAAFDVVYHSHLLEHFPREQAKPFFTECHRVLRPGGVLRVVVPDLEQICRLYLQALDRALQGDLEWQYNYEWIMLEMYDQCIRNYSGGEMLQYLMRDQIPNENFVAGRLGSFYQVLIRDINSLKVKKNAGDFAAMEKTNNEQIVQFRSSGEIHQWMYDRYSLKVLMERSEFYDVVLRNAADSYIPGWKDYCLDIDSHGSKYKADSLYMEGIKR